MNKYFCLLMTILLTVYGQLMIKWRILQYGDYQTNLFMRMYGLTKFILTDIYVISGFFSAFCASLFWMMAIKKMQLNVAYPFMSLSFVLVFIFSGLLFNEKITSLQVWGLILILLGVSLIGFSTKSS